MFKALSGLCTQNNPQKKQIVCTVWGLAEDNQLLSKEQQGKRLEWPSRDRWCEKDERFGGASVRLGAGHNISSVSHLPGCPRLGVKQTCRFSAVINQKKGKNTKLNIIRSMAFSIKLSNFSLNMPLSMRHCPVESRFIFLSTHTQVSYLNKDLWWLAVEIVFLFLFFINTKRYSVSKIEWGSFQRDVKWQNLIRWLEALASWSNLIRSMHLFGSSSAS